MTSKKQRAAAKQDPLIVLNQPGEKPEAAVTRTMLRPSVQAAITLRNIAPHRDEMSLEALMQELSHQCSAAVDGNLARGESMLMAQAHTLDILFNRLVVRASLNEGQYFDAAERLYRLALRAQGQCRSTVESLALIKNPPNLAFVKQANIGQAVQVNNGTSPASSAREIESTPNKLLEHSDGKRLDSGASTSAGATHSSMETVATSDGAEDIERKTDRLAKRVPRGPETDGTTDRQTIAQAPTID